MNTVQTRAAGNVSGAKKARKPTATQLAARNKRRAMIAATVVVFCVALLARAYMAYAAFISYEHITSLASRMGLSGFEMRTCPIAIDGFAVLGLLMRLRYFADSTRRWGLGAAAVAGLLSLIANVAAGTNDGERAWGAIVVVMFLAAEVMSDRIKPAYTPAQRRSEAAKRAARTRKRATRARRDAELAEMLDGRIPANAPISPAPAGR